AIANPGSRRKRCRNDVPAVIGAHTHEVVALLDRKGSRQRRRQAPVSRPRDERGRAQVISSIRSRATLAHSAASGSTVMRLTTLPSTMFSRTQQRWAASTRNMVEQGQIKGSREN